MPKNEDRDLSAGAQPPPETDRERFERERLSRRQALKRFGMTSAMATFALFSVDDLARMVGKAMQQRAGDNKVAEQVAQEFQHAGVAMADGTSGSGSVACINCVTTKLQCLTKASNDYTNCLNGGGTNCDAINYGETMACRYSYASCCSLNNCNC